MKRSLVSSGGERSPSRCAFDIVREAKWDNALQCKFASADDAAFSFNVTCNVKNSKKFHWLNQACWRDNPQWLNYRYFQCCARACAKAGWVRPGVKPVLRGSSTSSFRVCFPIGHRKATGVNSWNCRHALTVPACSEQRRRLSSSRKPVTIAFLQLMPPAKNVPFH